MRYSQHPHYRDLPPKRFGIPVFGKRRAFLHGSRVYKQILIAVDLTEAASTVVLEHAAGIAESDSTTHVLHVVEPQYVQYSMDPTLTGSMTRDLEQTAVANATERLAELCKAYGIPPEAQHVRLGRAAHEVHAAAQELDADLIVIGSHGYHGWRNILGSTANAVLHGTPVDTLVALLPRT